MPTSRSAAPSRRGLLTILSLFLLGALFLAGLYTTAYLDVPAEHRASSPGLPPRPLRVLSWDLDWQTPSDLLDLIRSHTPDVLLLHRVTRKTAQDVARALDMTHAGELQMYFTPTHPGDASEPGNAVLARHALFKGRPIPKPKYPIDPNNPPPQGFGVWAEIVIDQKRFLAGSFHWTHGSEELERRSLLDAWQKQGALPLILSAAGGTHPTTQTSTPTLHRIGETATPTGLVASPEWALRVVSPAPRILVATTSGVTPPATNPSTTSP